MIQTGGYLEFTGQPFQSTWAPGSVKRPCLKKEDGGQIWWHMSPIAALGTQRQAELYEFKYSLVYIVSARPARDTQ